MHFECSQLSNQNQQLHADLQKALANIEYLNLDNQNLKKLFSRHRNVSIDNKYVSVDKKQKENSYIKNNYESSVNDTLNIDP